MFWTSLNYYSYQSKQEKQRKKHYILEINIITTRYNSYNW